MNVENVKFWKQQESFVLCAGKKVSLFFFHALDYKSRDVYITFKIAFRFDLNRQ
jgi:hypothetical protein